MTPYFKIFDRKWQVCVKNKIFLKQISIQIYEKEYFFSENLSLKDPLFCVKFHFSHKEASSFFFFFFFCNSPNAQYVENWGLTPTLCFI